jgi:hypothetical protein
MNYHFLIDHWFANDFINSAERITPGINKYILTFAAPSKHVKSELGVFVPYGTEQMNSLLSRITSNDRVYVHWFHAPVMEVVEKLNAEVPLYLMFWGGDFIGLTKRFEDENHDRLTKRYLNSLKWNIRHFLSISNLKAEIKKLISGNPILKQQIQIRKKFLNRLNYFCHWNPIDFDIVISEYGGHPKYLDFFYGGVLDFVPEPSLETIQKEEHSIWLGNSDTSTNNHFDAIKVLSKFKEQNIQIICPLSYGFGNYGNDVDTKGVLVFGRQWTSIRKHMSLESYIDLQRKADIVVMYHNRSQASGNIMAFIKMGKKVYLKSQSSLYQLLRNSGITLFDANQIERIDFTEFIRPLTREEVEANNRIISKLFSLEDQTRNYISILASKN